MPVAQSPLARSTPAAPHQKRPCGMSHVARRVRRAWCLSSLTGAMPPGERRGRLVRTGAAFGGFGAIRFPVVCAVELRRKPNRGDTANVARSPIGPQCSVMCSLGRRSTAEPSDSRQRRRGNGDPLARRDAPSICPSGQMPAGKRRRRRARHGAAAKSFALIGACRVRAAQCAGEITVAPPPTRVAASLAHHDRSYVQPEGGVRRIGETAAPGDTATSPR